MTDAPSLPAQMEAVRWHIEYWKSRNLNDHAQEMCDVLVTLQQHERLEAEVARLSETAGEDYERGVQAGMKLSADHIERLEAIVKAARQWRLSLEDDGWDEKAIMDLARPGIYVLFSALAALDTAAPDKPEDAERGLRRDG